MGLFALALFLWPITRTWYLGDDAYVAFHPDAIVQRGDSLAGETFEEIARAVELLGRFTPLSSFIVVPAFWLTPSVFAYKVGVVLVTLVSAAMAAILLKQLGFGWAHAALLPVVLCALVQLRYWHDPLLGYAANMPIVACLVLASLSALAAAIRRGSLRLHVLAVGLFTAGCLYWEGTPLLVAVVVPVAWAIGEASLRDVVRRTAAFGAVAAGFVVVVLVLRAAAPPIHQEVVEYKANFAPDAVGTAMAKQLSGALPLSYLVTVARKPDEQRAVAPEHRASPYGAASSVQDVVPGFVASERNMISRALREPAAVVVLVLIALALAGALHAAFGAPVPRRGLLAAAAVGALLAGGAAVAPVLSNRWQREIFYGVPYLSVFLEYVGLALVAVAGLAALLGAQRRPRARASLAVLVGTAVVPVAALTYSLNIRVVDAFGGVKAAMELNEAALRAGLLRTARSSSELLLDQTVAPLGAHFVSVSSGTPVPPTYVLGEFDRIASHCRDTPATCLRAEAPSAYLTGLDPRGMPWSAVCRVDAASTRRESAAVCRGVVTVAIGGSRLPSPPCGSLVLDAVPVPSRDGAVSLPVPLADARTAGDVTFCAATLAGDVYARSVVVGPRRGLAEGPLQLLATSPSVTRARSPFNVQPDGQSAIAVAAVGATPSTRVVVDGVDLLTQYIDSSALTALVPKRLFARPGRREFSLRDRGTQSNSVPLFVTP